MRLQGLQPHLKILYTPESNSIMGTFEKYDPESTGFFLLSGYINCHNKLLAFCQRQVTKRFR
jgi:hypothetical protein